MGDRTNRHPFHWPLQFPEVFLAERNGFDAALGNPPFLGGQRLTGLYGEDYREYLVTYLGRGLRGAVSTNLTRGPIKGV